MSEAKYTVTKLPKGEADYLYDLMREFDGCSDADRLGKALAALDELGLRYQALQAENGRLRMRAEVGRSVCPYCGGEEAHNSDCELREGGQP